MVYLTHPQTLASFQEIVNSVRAIPEITKAFPYLLQNAIVMRGTDSQVAMAEWLFHQLDAAAGVQPVQSSSARQYATPGVANDEVQVLFLTHAWDVTKLQQIANTLRVITQLTKVFQCNATGAVSVRRPHRHGCVGGLALQPTRSGSAGERCGPANLSDAGRRRRCDASVLPGACDDAGDHCQYCECASRRDEGAPYFQTTFLMP